MIVGEPVVKAEEEPEEPTEEPLEGEPMEASQTVEDTSAGEASQVRYEEPATTEEMPSEHENPAIVGDDEPIADEEERPRERYDRYGYSEEGSAKIYHKAHRVNVILALLIGLLAGVLIGYFGRGFINLTGVKSVNISADDVPLRRRKQPRPLILTRQPQRRFRTA